MTRAKLKPWRIDRPEENEDMSALDYIDKAVQIITPLQNMQKQGNQGRAKNFGKRAG